MSLIRVVMIVLVVAVLMTGIVEITGECGALNQRCDEGSSLCCPGFTCQDMELKNGKNEGICICSTLNQRCHKGSRPCCSGLSCEGTELHDDKEGICYKTGTSK